VLRVFSCTCAAEFDNFSSFHFNVGDVSLLNEMTDNDPSFVVSVAQVQDQTVLGSKGVSC